MTWITLTRTSFTGFVEVLVNMDKVDMITQGSGGRGSVLWFRKTEIDVIETQAQIAAMLPFGAKPVPGNYRSPESPS